MDEALEYPSMLTSFTDREIHNASRGDLADSGSTTLSLTPQ